MRLQLLFRVALAALIARIEADKSGDKSRWAKALKKYGLRLQFCPILGSWVYEGDDYGNAERHQEFEEESNEEEVDYEQSFFDVFEGLKLLEHLSQAGRMRGDLCAVGPGEDPLATLQPFKDDFEAANTKLWNVAKTDPELVFLDYAEKEWRFQKRTPAPASQPAPAPLPAPTTTSTQAPQPVASKRINYYAKNQQKLEEWEEVINQGETSEGDIFAHISGSTDYLDVLDAQQEAVERDLLEKNFGEDTAAVKSAPTPVSQPPTPPVSESPVHVDTTLTLSWDEFTCHAESMQLDDIWSTTGQVAQPKFSAPVATTVNTTGVQPRAVSPAAVLSGSGADSAAPTASSNGTVTNTAGVSDSNSSSEAVSLPVAPLATAHISSTAGSAGPVSTSSGSKKRKPSDKKHDDDDEPIAKRARSLDVAEPKTSTTLPASSPNKPRSEDVPQQTDVGEDFDLPLDDELPTEENGTDGEETTISSMTASSSRGKETGQSSFQSLMSLEQQTTVPVPALNASSSITSTAVIPDVGPSTLNPQTVSAPVVAARQLDRPLDTQPRLDLMQLARNPINGLTNLSSHRRISTLSPAQNVTPWADTSRGNAADPSTTSQHSSQRTSGTPNVESNTPNVLPTSLNAGGQIRPSYWEKFEKQLRDEASKPFSSGSQLLYSDYLTAVQGPLQPLTHDRSSAPQDYTIPLSPKHMGFWVIRFKRAILHQSDSDMAKDPLVYKVFRKTIVAEDQSGKWSIRGDVLASIERFLWDLVGRIQRERIYGSPLPIYFLSPQPSSSTGSPGSMTFEKHALFIESQFRHRKDFAMTMIQQYEMQQRTSTLGNVESLLRGLDAEAEQRRALDKSTPMNSHQKEAPTSAAKPAANGPAFGRSGVEQVSSQGSAQASTRVQTAIAGLAPTRSAVPDKMPVPTPNLGSTPALAARPTPTTSALAGPVPVAEPRRAPILTNTLPHSTQDPVSKPTPVSVQPKPTKTPAMQLPTPTQQASVQAGVKRGRHDIFDLDALQHPEKRQKTVDPQASGRGFPNNGEGSSRQNTTDLNHRPSVQVDVAQQDALEPPYTTTQGLVSANGTPSSAAQRNPLPSTAPHPPAAPLTSQNGAQGTPDNLLSSFRQWPDSTKAYVFYVLQSVKSRQNFWSDPRWSYDDLKAVAQSLTLEEAKAVFKEADAERKKSQIFEDYCISFLFHSTSERRAQLLEGSKSALKHYNDCIEGTVLGQRLQASANPASAQPLPLQTVPPAQPAPTRMQDAAPPTAVLQQPQGQSALSAASIQAQVANAQEKPRPILPKLAPAPTPRVPVTSPAHTEPRDLSSGAQTGVKRRRDEAVDGYMLQGRDKKQRLLDAATLTPASQSRPQSAGEGTAARPLMVEDSPPMAAAQASQVPRQNNVGQPRTPTQGQLTSAVQSSGGQVQFHPACRAKAMKFLRIPPERRYDEWKNTSHQDRKPISHGLFPSEINKVAREAYATQNDQQGLFIGIYAYMSAQHRERILGPGSEILQNVNRAIDRAWEAQRQFHEAQVAAQHNQPVPSAAAGPSGQMQPIQAQPRQQAQGQVDVRGPSSDAPAQATTRSTRASSSQDPATSTVSEAGSTSQSAALHPRADNEEAVQLALAFHSAPALSRPRLFGKIPLNFRSGVMKLLGKKRCLEVLASSQSEEFTNALLSAMPPEIRSFVESNQNPAQYIPRGTDVASGSPSFSGPAMGFNHPSLMQYPQQWSPVNTHQSNPAVMRHAAQNFPIQNQVPGHHMHQAGFPGQYPRHGVGQRFHGYASQHHSQAYAPNNQGFGSLGEQCQFYHAQPPFNQSHPAFASPDRGYSTNSQPQRFPADWSRAPQTGNDFVRAPDGRMHFDPDAHQHEFQSQPTQSARDHNGMDWAFQQN